MFFFFVYLLLERGGGNKSLQMPKTTFDLSGGKKKDSVAYNIRNYNLIFIDRIETPGLLFYYIDVSPSS